MANHKILKSFKLHTAGILSLAIDQSLKDKQSIYSCSTDETIGIWSASDDDLEYDVKNLSNPCRNVLALFDDDLYVAETADSVHENKQQVVVKYKIDGFLASMPILKFSLEVTALALSSDGQYLAAGANDFFVKCICLTNGDRGYERYECNAPIVNLCFDPKTVFLAISSADGNVQIRQVVRTPDNPKKPIAQFKACAAFNHITHKTSRMQVAWTSDGEKLLIPGRGGIAIIDCFKWTEEKLLTHPDTNHDIFSVATISNHNDFLASVTLRGQILVWNMNGSTFQIHSFIDTAKYGGSVTSLLFRPNEDGSIVTAFSDGHLGLIKNLTISTSSNSTPTETRKTSKTITKTTKDTSNFYSEDMASASRNSRINSHNDDDENNLFMEEGNSLIDDDEVDLGKIKSQYGFNENGEFVGKSGGDIHMPQITDTNLGSMKTSQITNNNNKYRGLMMEACTTLKRMRVPKPFVSGATPEANSQRYLMWNNFGIIRSFKTADESTIEIEFHDATIHSEIVLDNTATNYVFGDLNNNLVALASRGNSDRDSDLYISHIGAWDGDSREWNYTLKDYEFIEFLTVGSDFVAIFTSSRFLRLFTATGTQRIVACLPGPLLTMRASENWLAIVRPTGGVVIMGDDNYEHQICADLYYVNVLQPTNSSNGTPLLPIQQQIPIVLSENTHLEWIGFSIPNSCLISMDSSFMVRLLFRGGGNFGIWHPIFNGLTKLLSERAPDDSIWPVAVLERSVAGVVGQFRYVFCKSAKYPQATKTLIPLTVQWDIPVLAQDTERGKLEGQLITNELLQGILRLGQQMVFDGNSSTNEISTLTKAHMANLIKLFALACKTGRECRAEELGNLANNNQTIQILCNYASQNQRPNLSERVANIGRAKLQNNPSKIDKIVTSHIQGAPNLIHCPSTSSSIPNTNGETSKDPEMAPTKTLLNKRKLQQQKQNTTKIFEKEQQNNISTLDDTDDFFNQTLEDSFTATTTPGGSLNSKVLTKNPFKKTVENANEKSADLDSECGFFESLSTLTSKKRKFV